MKWITKEEATLENILDLIEFAVEQTEKAIRGEILYKEKPIVVNMAYFSFCLAGIAHYVITGRDRRTKEEQFALFLLDSLRGVFGGEELRYAKELGLLIPDFPSRYGAYNVDHVLTHVRELLKLNGR